MRIGSNADGEGPKLVERAADLDPGKWSERLKRL